MNPIAPYIVWFKLAGILVILGAAFAGGCRVQANRDDAKLEAKSHALMVCEFDRATLAGTLTDVNTIAERAKADAKAQAGRVQDAIEQAKRERLAYEDEMDAIERDLLEAKRSPTCRAQLEQPLCVSLD